MKYNKIMSLALIIMLVGAVAFLIGVLTIRSVLGQVLWFIGLVLIVVSSILVICVRITTKKQDKDEKKKW